MTWMSMRLSVLFTLVAASSAPTQTEARTDPPPKPTVDLHGDALPPGAISRFGTLRLRHNGTLGSVALNSDGSLLATSDGRVQIRDTKTGQEVEQFRGNIQATVVAFSSDDKVLLTGDLNGLIQHWEVSSGKLLREFRPKESKPFQLAAFSADRSTCLLSDYTSRAVFVDVATGRELCQIEKKDGIRGLDLSPDGKLATTAGSDGFLRVWDARTGEMRREWKAPMSWGALVGFSADGKMLATSPSFDDLRFWDVATGKEVLRSPEGGYQMTFSPDCRTFVITNNEAVSLLDVKTGRVLRRLKGHKYGLGQIADLAFSADGRRLVTAGADHTIGLWDVATGNQVLSFTGHHGGVVSLAFSPDGKSLASGSAFDGTLIVWDVATSKARFVGEDHYLGIWAVAWSPDGSVLASGDGCNGQDRREAVIRLFDPREGKVLRRFPAHLNNVHSLDFSPDGKRLASVGWDARARIWDPATGKRVQQLRSSDYLESVAFSRDGKTLVLSARGGEVEAYRTEDWELLHHLNEGGGGLVRGEYLAFLPDGKTIVTREQEHTGNRQGTCEICFRGVEDGKVLRSFRLQGIDPHRHGRFALSPDGNLYAESRTDEKRGEGFQVWDTVAGKLVASKYGHSGAINVVAFSRDSRLVATGSSDTTVLLWDLSEDRLQFLWSDLAANPEDTQGASKRLAIAPANAFPWLAARLRKVAEKEARAAPLLLLLDDEEFEKREKASADLAEMGPAVRPILEMALADKPSTEVRLRIEAILRKFPSTGAGESPVDGSRAHSTLRLLERIGTTEARKVLGDVAKGPKESRLAHEAKAALQRLESSKSPEKERPR